MPLKNGQRNNEQPQPEPEEKYEKMPCGTQVHVINGHANFSCIGKTQQGLNCAEQCPFYYKKKS